MGALEFHPLRGPRTRKATAIELSELVTAARSALIGATGADEHGLTEAIAHLIAVGTSAGGARAKAVVALNPETGELRSGQVPADPGFEQWLLKLDGVGADLDLGATGHFGRIEFAYHRMALAAGIDMMECRLLEEGGRAHFMTRRFDRVDDGHKVHTQTLCALAHLDFRQIGAHDYAQLLLCIEQLGLGPEARAEAFRRMAFNVAAANCDDHTKNFSFVLPEGGRWALSPAYDVTHAHAPDSRWTRQHLMAVNGRTTADHAGRRPRGGRPFRRAPALGHRRAGPRGRRQVARLRRRGRGARGDRRPHRRRHCAVVVPPPLTAHPRRSSAPARCNWCAAIGAAAIVPVRSVQAPVRASPARRRPGGPRCGSGRRSWRWPRRGSCARFPPTGRAWRRCRRPSPPNATPPARRVRGR